MNSFSRLDYIDWNDAFSLVLINYQSRQFISSTQRTVVWCDVTWFSYHFEFISFYSTYRTIIETISNAELWKDLDQILYSTAHSCDKVLSRMKSCEFR